MYRQQHVVAGFRHLTGAGRTRVKVRAAHRVEHRLRGGEHRFIAATHKRQRAGPGRGHAAGHRRIQKTDTACARCRADLTRCRRVDGGAVQHRCALAQGGEQPAVFQVQLRHVSARGQH